MTLALRVLTLSILAFAHLVGEAGAARADAVSGAAAEIAASETIELEGGDTIHPTTQQWLERMQNRHGWVH